MLNQRATERLPPPARNIPFFNYPALFVGEEEELVRIFRNVGRRGAFIMQRDLAEFEANLAAYAGAKFAVGVGNATDGLFFALMAGGLKQGDEVIICSHTMMATASAVHFAGGVPVPVEVGPDRLIDIDAIEGAINKRTRAIMPTQLNGRTADMDAIQAICDRHGLLLFEDAAQALGSRWKGKAAGTFGVASAFSFYPAKILGCLGDGGGVVTNDPEVYRNLLMLRDFGKNTAGEFERWAMNSRLDNLQAAILDFRLKAYGDVIARRRLIAAHYQRRLGRYSSLSLPPPPSDGDHFDVFQNYEIVVERRDALKAFLLTQGVGTLIQWNGQPIHQQRKLGFTQRLPKTDAFFERCLMLPMNMSVTDDEVDFICDCIEEFYRRG